MIDKVYVVSSGSYSDYTIRAIFIDKESADEYFHELKKCHSDADIEEHKVGRPDKAIARPVWYAYISIGTGKITEYSGHRMSEVELPDSPISEEINTLIDSYARNKKFHYDAQVTSMKSQEHANKLAVELRQAVLRELSLRGVTVGS